MHPSEPMMIKLTLCLLQEFLCHTDEKKQKKMLMLVMIVGMDKR